jgi:hypothetical protein
LHHQRRGRRRAGGLRKHQEIENVKVEESFQLQSELAEKAGEGCYVSATTSNNKRFYGVLVDQAALKEASDLWFQDQADSLELNRRMKLLIEQKEKEDSKTSDEAAEAIVDGKDVNVHANGETGETAKRIHDSVENGDHKRAKTSESASIKLPASAKDSAVQKFRYVSSSPSTETASDYRVLVATFCDVNEASNGDPEQAERILAACEAGGNFFGSYYYQYEVLPATLTSQKAKASAFEMRTSMGLHSFLQDTKLPAFHPLSNLQSGSSHKVLSMLNMKRDSSGNVIWDQQSSKSSEAEAAFLAGGTRLQSVPMQPRSGRQYEIGVIGGGIAGLACCQELVTLLRNEGINAKVTLMEARSRLGGRLWTDKLESTEDKESVPIEVSSFMSLYSIWFQRFRCLTS